MNYYIQGNAERSNELKAAFKREGFAIPGYDFGDDGSFFFTHNKNKLVCCCSIHSGVVDIIKTHPDYQELELPVEPRFKAGQTVVFDGSVLTIHRIIEGYYLFNKEGSRGCRIDQQDKFIELKFNVDDYIRHKKTGATATVVSIDGKYYHVHGHPMIPIEEQDQWAMFNERKFKVGDLVVYRDLIGRVQDVIWQDRFGWAYKVGDISGIHECDLQPADHRDVTRIVKNG